jgi:hypothetical protein
LFNNLILKWVVVKKKFGEARCILAGVAYKRDLEYLAKGWFVFELHTPPKTSVSVKLHFDSRGSGKNRIVVSFIT